ncbi:MAG: VCBS repeat-containing protein [Anaerolineales bacterium]|nr:VCBS repeat-containing protein [Anaerolineales bacterium]
MTRPGRIRYVFMTGGALLLLLWQIAAAQPAPQPSQAPRYYKSRLGLMPAAYGAAPTGAAQADGAVSNGRLNAPAIYPTGSWPEAVAHGRFSPTQPPGALLATAFSFDPANDNQLHHFAQAGGALTRTRQLPAGAHPTALARGDFNADGRSDVAVANQADDTLGLFLQTVTGTLGSMVAYPTGAAPDGVAVGDFNADLRDDVAVSHAAAPFVLVFLQQADGTLGAPLTLPVGSAGFNELEAGDLNGDGFDDLALLRGAGYADEQVALFYQQNRTLAAPLFYTAVDGGYLAHGLAVGDVTADGRADLVVTAGGNTPNAFLNVFPQLPDGTLPLTPTVYAAYHLPEAVEIGDLNHDGAADVALVHAAWMALSVYTQTVTGTLAAPAQTPLPYTDYYRPDGLALGDVSGDGGLDVLLASHSALPQENGLVVLTNAGAAPTSTITSPAAHAAISGTTTLEITGLAGPTAVSLQISPDGGRTWQTHTAVSPWTYAWPIPAADGLYTILVRAVDAAGAVQYPPAARKLLVDRTPPLGALRINNGALFTNDPVVTLHTSSTDLGAIAHMRFANAGAAFTPWLGYATPYTWTLSGGDGIKQVDGRLRDLVGFVSPPISDTIILDTTPPTASLRINAGAHATLVPTVTLTLAAADENGITGIRFANAGGAYTDWLSLTAVYPWQLLPPSGVKTVYAQVRDAAGNVTTVSATITLGAYLYLPIVPRP